MLLGDLLRRNRKLFPDRTAFVFEGKRFTYTEADERANRLANALIRLEVKREDHVAILSKNCNEYLETYFACARSGSICTAINYRLTRHELHYVLENSAANVVIVSDEFLGTLEEVLYTHPAIAEAAVIGVPDEQWGETIKAFVVLKEAQKATEEEIFDFSRQYLAGFKRPRSVEFTGSLPRNLSGKVLKKVLREPYWRDQQRQVH